MRSFSARLLLGVLLMGVLPLAASAATTSYGPTAYLQTGETPAGFYCPSCADPLHLETFEDAMLDAFLTIDHGEIFPPNGVSGNNMPSTDSVDGDDGSVDGSGLMGASWFTGDSSNVTITFGSSVTSAGLVFTDGDIASSNIRLEAFDSNGISLGIIDAGDLADGVYNGTTAEDRFMGFHDDNGEIAKITLSMDAGSGIELDHIQWQNCQCIPEPAAAGLAFMGLLGLLNIRRRRR